MLCLVVLNYILVGCPCFLKTVRDNEASAKRDLTVLRLDFIHRLVNCIDDKRF